MDDKPRPLSEVFAAQAIPALLAAIAVYAAQLISPPLCAELLTAWRRLITESSDAAGLLRLLQDLWRF